MQDELLSDFSPAWCQALINSPAYIPVDYDDRCTPGQAADNRVITNTLFTRAWKTENTVRALYGLQAKTVQAPNVTPEFVVLYSLGTDLGGYRNIAHGGVLMTLLDQTIGECAGREWGLRVVTIELNCVLKRPFRLPGVVVARAVAVRQEGKRVWLKGSLEDEHGRSCMEATALFVVREHGRL